MTVNDGLPPGTRGGLRTLIGFAVSIAALIWVWTRLNLGDVWTGIRTADSNALILGFILFYLSLPLRAWRWRILLANVGDEVRLGRLARTIFRGWVLNCALPGRSGDLYSAYLLREERGLSFLRTGGTIFTARVLDLVTIVALLAWIFLAGFRWSLPAAFGELIITGAQITGVLLLALIGLSITRRRLLGLLPERFAMQMRNFTDGLFGSLGSLPLIILTTLLIWLLEAARLWCVLAAVGVYASPDKAIFLALAAALVSTIPLTPGGLGTVEALYVELFPLFGLASAMTGSAIFLDRLINYWFILLAGLLYFLLMRGKG